MHTVLFQRRCFFFQKDIVLCSSYLKGCLCNQNSISNSGDPKAIRCICLKTLHINQPGLWYISSLWLAVKKKTDLHCCNIFFYDWCKIQSRELPSATLKTQSRHNVLQSRHIWAQRRLKLPASRIVCWCTHQRKLSNYRHLESFVDAHIKENSQITGISNRLLMHTSEKTSKLCVTGLCEENLSVTGGMPPVRRYFHPHDIFTPGWKYRYDIFTPSTIFSPPPYK